MQVFMRFWAAGRCLAGGAFSGDGSGVAGPVAGQCLADSRFAGPRFAPARELPIMPIDGERSAIRPPLLRPTGAHVPVYADECRCCRKIPGE